MSEVEWAKLKAHELRALAERGAVVILPVAAIEQHGPHLPVNTDMRIGHEVAVRAARKAAPAREVVVTPVIWHGLSEHHMPFGGTLTLEHDAFFAVLRSVLHSLVRHGFTELVLSNSHGGNIASMNLAVDRLSEALGATIVATTYAEEGAAAIAPLLEDQGGIMHAGEAETSMMLALEPDLVDASDLGALATERLAPYRRAGNASHRWRGFAHITANGISGNPTRASAEKGERILEAAAEAVAAMIVDPETWAAPRDRRPSRIGGVAFRDPPR